MARGKTSSARARTKAKSPTKAKASTSTAGTAKTATAPARRTTATSETGDGHTYRELYAEARRRDIKGRSSMDKAQLERVLNGKRGK
jgi:hypothetical protein